MAERRVLLPLLRGEGGREGGGVTWESKGQSAERKDRE
jgi:hypothetical protein